METQTKPTTVIQKVIASFLNATVSVCAGLLFFACYGHLIFFTVASFFVLNMIFLFRKDRREFGMLIAGSYWAERYPLWKHLVFALLYTASFATLFIWVWFPFDLLLINMLAVQLPFVVTTGTTLHGYLSGNMRTVVPENHTT